MNISIGSRTISFSDVKETVESYIRKFTSRILEKIDDAYNYDGGLYIIKDFNGGNKIKLTTDAIGIEISEDNFVLKSSSGVLTIENGRSKVIDFSDGNGNTGVYAYVAGDSGVVDGRIFANFEIIVGANDKSNSLIAGDGGSNLWGGAGFSADILVGGLGIDHFSIGKSEGNDHIANAAQDDIVDLHDVTLDDISFTASEGNVIGVAFKTGCVLTVESTAENSPVFQLSDGTRYSYNCAASVWRSA